MARGKFVKTQKQWLRFHVLMTVTGSDPLTHAGLFQDPEGELATLTRVIRMFMTVQIVMGSVEPVPNWFNGAGMPMLGLGLVRTDPDMPNNSLSVLSGNDADKAWLYRQDYRVPFDAVLGTPQSGYLNTFGDPYYLDWQLRAGNGTNVNRDVELRLVLECQNVATTSTFHVDLNGLVLCE